MGINFIFFRRISSQNMWADSIFQPFWNRHWLHHCSIHKHDVCLFTYTFTLSQFKRLLFQTILINLWVELIGRSKDRIASMRAEVRTCATCRAIHTWLLLVLWKLFYLKSRISIKYGGSQSLLLLCPLPTLELDWGLELHKLLVRYKLITLMNLIWLINLAVIIFKKKLNGNYGLMCYALITS